jgi:hypothetical protein
MTLFVYNQNIPFATNNPSVDQPNMQVNTNSIFNLIEVNHQGFNLNNGGFHTIIQFIDQGNTTPPKVTGSGQLFTNTVSGDQELFYESGNGVISQLTTTGITPSPNPNGFTYLPGGIILQWGLLSQSFGSGSTTGTVTFATANIAFPNNCFIVTGNPLVSFANLPSSQGSVNIRQNGISKTSFQWQFFTNSNQYIGFTWFAIGN